MNEEEKEIIESLIKGDRECLEMELRVNPNNKEDIEHWEKEIKALEKLSNLYEKEKARADKLEKDYSKLLTKLDELGVDVNE